MSWRAFLGEGKYRRISAWLAAMFSLDLVESLIHSFFQVVRALDDPVAHVVGGGFSTRLQVFTLNCCLVSLLVADYCCGVFRVAPGFLRDAFDLFGGAGICQPLITAGFTY